MKKILGLDLGTTSIGWAFIEESDGASTSSKIINAGVRIVPISSDNEQEFTKGQAISMNADRRLKRGARRNLQRYKLRREQLIKTLREAGIITEEFIYAEKGKNSTFSTLKSRARAAVEPVSLDELAKVFLMINGKRGYKSNRKADNTEEDEGTTIDAIGVAQILHDEGLTPGEWLHRNAQDGELKSMDFYASDLEAEIEKILEFQANFYPEINPLALGQEIQGKGRTEVKNILEENWGVPLAENKEGTKDEKMTRLYAWRHRAVHEKISLSELALILTEICAQLRNVSNYLGKISDRSKILKFNNVTVGQYLYGQVTKNPRARLKNQVFFRQDYIDEFEKIWSVQSQQHPLLTDKLKKEIKDITIFYQRPLRSQKHLLSNCEFEPSRKVIPKSHPLFQEFRLLQILNNLKVYHPDTPNTTEDLCEEHRELLLGYLRFKDKLTANEITKLIGYKGWDCNYEKVEGNRTNRQFFEAFKAIIELEDNTELDFQSLIRADLVLDQFSEAFLRMGIDPNVLFFRADAEADDLEKQPYMQLWHLLYTMEDEQKLTKQLKKRFGFQDQHIKILKSIKLENDYGSLSSKAIKRILPYLQSGQIYSDACESAGYNHSGFIKKEENENRKLLDKLPIIKRNSLRNPVVEKILNHMVNIVNAVMKHPEMGRPDEIRIELARELKSSADERKRLTKTIADNTKENEKVRRILEQDYKLFPVTKNDIIRYKLWKETDGISLYTGKAIPASKLFSPEYDIEHIIPKSRLFDDSFSNKTICERELNIKKGNQTAASFLKGEYSAEGYAQYLERVKDIKGKITLSKYQKLLMEDEKIPEDFIQRQLRESQYISKKAKEMLLDITRKVTVTSGAITSKLRNDWGLEELLREINLEKYKQVGLVKQVPMKNGQTKQKIADWSKRDDHRHHAMDAITVAFTKQAYINYLNNLNAKSNQGHDIRGIEIKHGRKENGKFIFKPPIENMREAVKASLASILISFKASGKVTTKSRNRIKIGKDKFMDVWQDAPRGSLHNETIYGKINQYQTSYEKPGGSFDLPKIEKVAKKKHREALMTRLAENGMDPKKAFTGKNSLAKNPIYLDAEKTKTLPEKVKLVELGEVFTTRKAIDEGLRIDKIIDPKIRLILEKRLQAFGGNNKAAFSNLEENPIWQNDEQKIPITKVTLRGIANGLALRDKYDHLGKPILDKDGMPVPAGFVNTGNNHHVAIYEDEEGNLHEEVVSFFEAVERTNKKLPLIKKTHEKGWKFKFSLKINDMFLIPDDSFDPSEVDLTDKKNYPLLSRRLFRVQKVSSRYYVFNHHLETRAVTPDTLKSKKELSKTTYYLIQTPNQLKRLIKLRVSNIGEITGLIND